MEMKENERNEEVGIGHVLPNIKRGFRILYEGFFAQSTCKALPQLKSARLKQETAIAEWSTFPPRNFFLSGSNKSIDTVGIILQDVVACIPDRWLHLVFWSKSPKLMLLANSLHDGSFFISRRPYRTALPALQISRSLIAFISSSYFSL